MEIETTKARRKCRDCKCTIEKGEVIGVSRVESQFGTKKVSYCKPCTIKGLEVRKKRIEGYLKQIRGM